MTVSIAGLRAAKLQPGVALFNTGVVGVFSYEGPYVATVAMAANGVTTLVTNGVTSTITPTIDVTTGFLYKAAIEAVEGWKFKLAGIRGDSLVYATTIAGIFNTFSTHTMTRAGKEATFDEDFLKLGTCFGRESDADLPASCRDSSAIVRLFAEREVNRNDCPVAVGGFIKQVGFNGAFGGGAPAWYVSICSQTEDIAYIVNGKATGAATGVLATLTEAIDFGSGLVVAPGQRIVVEVRNTVKFTAGGIIQTNGGYGEML